MYKEFPIQTLTKEYKVIRVIENGAEGEKKLVYHIDDDNREDKKLYLVKVLPCTNKEDLKRYERELDVMKSLNHKNIAKIEKSIEEQEKLMIFLNYFEKGSLADIFNHKKRLDEEECKLYFEQIIEGTDYCHVNGICHRDIKPDNMQSNFFFFFSYFCNFFHFFKIRLLHGDGKTVVLSDFGLCAQISPNQLLNDFPGTPLYLSPEKYKVYHFFFF